MARDRKGTLGRYYCGGPGDGGHYTADPLIPCDPPSPVPSQRSSSSHLFAMLTVKRGCRDFGFSLISYEEKDTGIFVARVVPGGQAARYGVQENDKILTINGKTPLNIEDAIDVIKQAGAQIKLVVLREEDITIDEAGFVASTGSTTWEREYQNRYPEDTESTRRGNTGNSRSTRSTGSTMHRRTSTADISQHECSEDGAIRLQMASNLILLIGSILKVEMQPM